ncbi:MAG: XamI family restriction endonuclease [Aquabacterium sp.]|uniref:XamI family restriction endonuclease n=1 Tax=Aquabacterium sp. TaxID=1872578 RepID=UPI0025BC8A10|nr:XamI family restriction endonuclease [Aquabacterium sp.]MBI5926480.1 XamI family restriction endonuclease [Aquabacterium sp.]
MTVDAIYEYHTKQAEVAKAIYIASRTPDSDANDWNLAIREARALLADALRASNLLQSVDQALQTKGAHMLAFRHMTAPPISQDQFSLACPEWIKGSEKPESRPLKAIAASAVAAQFHIRRSRPLTPWVTEGRKPRMTEVKRLLWSVAPLLASQQLATLQRNRAASAQEGAVIDLLASKGWTRLQASLLDTRATLPVRHYMHKTRFATASNAPQEVDIALGLEGSIVLATECKVSNDATNSIKRVNDVLKKAKAWKDHWGNFVKTAALLQGVIAAKDVHRLLDDGVEVFWSHDLSVFETWIDART